MEPSYLDTQITRTTAESILQLISFEFAAASHLNWWTKSLIPWLLQAPSQLQTVILSANSLRLSTYKKSLCVAAGYSKHSPWCIIICNIHNAIFGALKWWIYIDFSHNKQSIAMLLCSITRKSSTSNVDCVIWFCNSTARWATRWSRSLDCWINLWYACHTVSVHLFV